MTGHLEEIQDTHINLEEIQEAELQDTHMNQHESGHPLELQDTQVKHRTATKFIWVSCISPNLCGCPVIPCHLYGCPVIPSLL